jgi:hypothetical protein
MAAPPQLYRQGAYESPVRADPDDLLLLPGYGLAVDDAVSYQAISDTTATVRSPRELPTQSTAESGVATIVSTKDIPYSLTIRLPQVLRKDQSYALFVHTAAGEWSEPVYINDARPLWFSPAYVYQGDPVAALPRELKVIGRNLQPGPGRSTQVRLNGPQTYAASAISDSKSSATIDHYVARISLPASLATGRYQIQLSRDGVSWITVPGQMLEVKPNPQPATQYSVSDPQFGGCRANDNADDTACIARAVAAAQRAGGGVVYFGPGTWDVVDPRQSGLVPGEGIVIPPRVQLRGAGRDSTSLQRHAEWNQTVPSAVFTLQGHTIVSGFTFRDLQIYHPQENAGPILQVGEQWQRVAASDPGLVSDVTISQNTFDRTFVAIGNGGLPIERLFITFNTFGAYNSAIELAGDQLSMVRKYRVDDSVINSNVFMPGSKLDLVAKTGAIGSEIGAGQRVDFSSNNADGSSTEYLYAPTDARGWRAAFFWNMNNNIEEQLVSQNTASCTGDKIGDGEAIAFDNNTNTFAFANVAEVASATSSSVAVSAPLMTRQHDRDLAADYYVDHWMQIVSGQGLGQARKVIGYSIDPVAHLTTFRVAPNWDVTPAAGRSRVAVGREYWQLYALDNFIDGRRPLCQKSNRSRRASGTIVLWAQSADSVIEGNRQYDTGGIVVQQAYVLPEHACRDCAMESFFQSSLEIRANTVDGEYDWDNDCSESGIVAGLAAAPWNDAAPPTVSFGVSIAHNTVRHADALRGGGIAQLDTWYPGPKPQRWPLSVDTLIHHNLIEDIAGARAQPACGASHARIGINFPEPQIAWRTVLYANSCSNVSVPVGGSGIDTVRVCPSSAASSCECP